MTRLKEFLEEKEKKDKKEELDEAASNPKVAKEILRQIKALDKWAFNAWGGKNKVFFDNGIQFDVKGSKFRGKVIITLDRGNDTYSVELGNIRNLDWKSKRLIPNVFAGDLVNILDQHIG